MGSTRTIKICCLHAPKDKDSFEELAGHLASLKKNSAMAMECWGMGWLKPDEEPEPTIDSHLRDADIILLLLSQDLLIAANGHTKYIADALELGVKTKTVVIPVKLRPSGDDVSLQKLQGLPLGDLPISLYSESEREQVWVAVAKAIHATALALPPRLPPAPPDPLASSSPRVRSLLATTIQSGAASKRLASEVRARVAAPHRSRRRKVLGGAALLLALLVLVVLGSPSRQVLTFSGRGGVVVVTPWAIRSGYRETQRRLCEDLQSLGGLEVQCISRSLLTSQSSVRTAAERAGAAVAAFVEPDETVVIAPLGTSVLPVDFLPPVRMTGAATKGVVEILGTLGRPADWARRTDEAPSPLIHASSAGPELALLAVLHHWVWGGGRSPADETNAAEYRALIDRLEGELCQDRQRDHHDRACALARYLDALACPATNVEFCEPRLNNLRSLARDTPDLRLRLMAGVEVARRTCTTAPDEARSLMEVLERKLPAERPCDRLLLLPPATCLLATQPAQAAGERSAWTQIEVQTKASLACGPSLLGTILGEQGYWWMRGKRWEEARKAFKAARDEMPKDPEQALNLAEAQLLLGNREETRRGISLSHIPPNLKTHAAFLLWLATGAGEDLGALKESYAALRPGQHGVFDAAGALEGLVCQEPDSRTCRVFRALHRPKTQDEVAKAAALVEEL